MGNFSFDIVSDYDLSEINNVFDQTRREIDNRYDFKNTSADLEWLDESKTGVKIIGDNQFQLDSIADIFRKKLASRNQSQKLLDTSSEPTTSNMKMTWEVTFRKGLDQEKAKKITAVIREKYPKVKAQIQGEEIRVTSSSKDDLQSVMTIVKEKDFDFPINFTNYR